MSETERAPWDRRDGESGPAYEAFVIYRDLGPSERSQERVSSELAKSRQLVSRWSAQHDWVERVEEYDRRIDQAKQVATMDTTGEMARRHARWAAETGEALMAPVRALLKRIEKLEAENPDDPFHDFELRELMRLSETAARCLAAVGQFERLARGLSTANLGGSDGGPLFEGATRTDLEAFLTGLPDGSGDTLAAGVSANGDGNGHPAESVHAET